MFVSRVGLEDHDGCNVGHRGGEFDGRFVKHPIAKQIEGPEDHPARCEW